MARTLRIGNNRGLRLCTDASFATHQDAKNHTGFVLSVGEAIIVRNMSVKSNMKKITDEEITARTYAEVVKNTSKQNKIQKGKNRR